MRRPRRSARLFLALVVTAAVATGLVSPGAGPAAAKGKGRSHGHGSERLAALPSLRTPVTDEDFYFVMGDRFANGSTANDTGGIPGGKLDHGFDPTAKGFYNGGDLAGLTSKLNYIKGLGTDSIWLTPIFKNKPVQPEDGPSAGYHGYWITDFTKVDPHLGTNAELAALVQAAHAKGMKVYFDIITNHTADVIGYQEGARTGYVSKDVEPYRTASGRAFDDRDYAGTKRFPDLDPNVSFPYHPVLDPAETDLKRPRWLNDVTLYHNRGDTTFTGENSQYGDFFGLDDLFTENPRVVDGMVDIYRTWVGDFGIDGFRIDTMKHVDDAFWQRFGPGLLSYAHSHGKPDFFMFGEVALDGSGSAQKAFTSHYTTTDKMQAILDFPFQDAARGFASRGRNTTDLAQFFVNDDWYTDGDSNAYELPTFLGNHDMGRIGNFVRSDNSGAAEEELVARDRLAHELMYFSRGNPVVFYGDEQGFTGDGGDQLARQSMFASQVPEYLDDDLLGTTATHAQDNFVTTHPLYRKISELADLTARHPALRNGAQQVRYASDAPGVFAYSRIDRRQQREYVVALNNSESDKTAAVPTYVANGSFTKVYGAGPASVTSAADRSLAVSVPALSTVVYESAARIPVSRRAPHITLQPPAPTQESRSRLHVAADVAGSSFYEVTFYVRGKHGDWLPIGTDDTAPYQVFHDTSAMPTGTGLSYRAVVADNAGHQRRSRVRQTAVPAPLVTMTAPADGGEVTRIADVTVQAVVDPERGANVVRLERSVSGGPWRAIGTDRSSPVYTAFDDVSELVLGTTVRYRAVLTSPTRAVSAPVTVTVSPPRPLVGSVTVAGNLESEITGGACEDWTPPCAAAHLVFDETDGRWKRTFRVPAGSWEWKVAINDSWAESYGEGGGSGNIALTIPAGGADVTFLWNQDTKVPSATVH